MCAEVQQSSLRTQNRCNLQQARMFQRVANETTLYLTPREAWLLKNLLGCVRVRFLAVHLPRIKSKKVVKESKASVNREMPSAISDLA